MNIKGLTMREISALMEKYVADYFRDSKVCNYKNELFTESYSLEINEIGIELPQRYLFNDTNTINSASGYIYLADTKHHT